MVEIRNNITKVRSYFICQNCGCQNTKWMGRCPDCGEWNSMIEEATSPKRNKHERLGKEVKKSVSINEIKLDKTPRIFSSMNELDRIFGGGIVKDAITLVGGNPGIGKSTLLLQLANKLANKGYKVLYVSGEESEKQLKLRADRFYITSSKIYILSETFFEIIQEQIETLQPDFLIIDSIQTIYTEDLQSAPGSVSQLKEAANRFMLLAKSRNIATFIIGHVTKEGTIAGPKVLEHIVDTVLYIEGEGYSPYRILRITKNRFGPTGEIAVFEMKSDGLAEVTNPSELFLAERSIGNSGSVVVSSLEGTRPLLIELQALVSSSNFGVPRRTTTGVDYNRVSLLVAVIEKKAGLHLQTQDIFVNVAGGLKINEPAVDLGIVVALISSFKNIPVDKNNLFLGEVGLAGEVRGINLLDLRVKEAYKLGFDRCFVPARNLQKNKSKYEIELIGVESIQEVINYVF